MPILEWKYDMVAIVLDMGHHMTLELYNSILVIIDGITKPAHFILVKVNYNLYKLVKIYVKEVFRLNGVPISIIFYRDTITTLFVITYESCI